jgi:hypothetical protein
MRTPTSFLASHAEILAALVAAALFVLAAGITLIG